MAKKPTSSSTNRHSDGRKTTKSAMNPHISKLAKKSRKGGISEESSSVSNESLYGVTDICFQGKERVASWDEKQFDKGSLGDEHVYAILRAEGTSGCSSCEEATIHEPGKLTRLESVEI